MNISIELGNDTDNYNNQILFSQIYWYSVIAAIPLSVIGLVANLLLLYIFISDKFFHRSTYVLMLVSVVSDITSTITSIVCYSLLVDENLSIQSGSSMCKYFLFIISSSYGISIMTLCLIAIDRYFAVVQPFSRFYLSYKSRLIVIVEILIWLISTSTSAPMFLIISGYRDRYVVCDFPDMDLFATTYFIIFVMLLYVIPTTVIAIVYWRIIKHQRNYIQPGEATDRHKIQELKRRKLIRMLISIALTYILITWPVFAAIFGFAVTQTSLREIRDKNLALFFLAFFSVSLSASITVINPFLCFKFDSNIRSRSHRICKRIDIFRSSTIMMTIYD
ncbi:Neuropeptide FF receptor 2 [Trichoplax sp. H2]|nr:Neuropeptide FF receptor 2 [Trichoplax sp. H2]|eukprot:RDD39717.1 Neuropeptide FF receptor 2 [Trichoplax sp. H2]